LSSISVESIKAALLDPRVIAILQEKETESLIADAEISEGSVHKSAKPVKSVRKSIVKKVFWRCDSCFDVFEKPLKILDSCVCPSCKSKSVHSCIASDIVVLSKNNKSMVKQLLDAGYKCYKKPEMVLVKFEQVEGSF